MPAFRRTSLRALPVAAALTLVGLAAPAWAHTTLVNSGPAVREEVGTDTNLIALKFGEEVGGSLEVAVLDKDEKPVPVSDAQPAATDGSVVCARVAELEPGVHTVRYEVTSADEHVVRGSYQFTVKEGGSTPETLGCDVSALAEPTKEKALSDQDQSDFPAWAVWTIGGVAVVTAGLAAVAVVRSRREEDDDEVEATDLQE